jgi:hypothetical protein
MSFIRDNTAIPETKTDKNTVPSGQPTTKYIRAVDFNSVTTDLADIRTWLQGDADYVAAKANASPSLSTVTTAVIAFIGGILKASVGGGIFRSFVPTHFDPRDYGTCDPTGALDSTAAINAAIVAAFQSGSHLGSVVRLPPGQFKISSTILLPEAYGMRLEGAGIDATTLNTTAALAGLPAVMLRNCVWSGVVRFAINGLTANMPSAGIEIRNESGHSTGLSTKNYVTEVQIGDGGKQVVRGIDITGDNDNNNDFHTFTRVNVYGASEADACVNNTQSVGHIFIHCNFNGTVGSAKGLWVGSTRYRAADDAAIIASGGGNRGGKAHWQGGSSGGHTFADFVIDGEGPGSNIIEDCNSEASNRFVASAVYNGGIGGILSIRNCRFASMDGYMNADNIAIQWQYSGFLEVTGCRFDQLGAGRFAKIQVLSLEPSNHRIVGNYWNQYGSFEQDMILKPYGSGDTNYPGSMWVGCEESNLYLPTGTVDDDVCRWKGNTRPFGVSVLDFGCVGDGTTNNNNPLAQAKKYAEALTPVPDIYIPAGTFISSAPFVTTARVYGPGVIQDTGGATFVQHFDGRQLSSGTASNDTSGTPGNATLNTPLGRSALALGASAVTITNSLVVAGQLVDVIPEDIDTTALRFKVVPAAGSFTVTWNAIATAALKFRWKVKN